MVGAQPGEAGLDLVADVPGGQALVAVAGADPVAHLGGEHHLVAGAGAGVEPAPDHLLGAPAAVGVGRVEERDAVLAGGVHQRERGRLGLALTEQLRRGADAAEVAAAEPEHRHVQIRTAEAGISHGYVLPHRHPPRTVTHGSPPGPPPRNPGCRPGPLG